MSLIPGQTPPESRYTTGSAELFTEDGANGYETTLRRLKQWTAQSFAQQKLSQVGPILSGNAGDQNNPTNRVL